MLVFIRTLSIKIQNCKIIKHYTQNIQIKAYSASNIVIMWEFLKFFNLKFNFASFTSFYFLLFSFFFRGRGEFDCLIEKNHNTYSIQIKEIGFLDLDIILWNSGLLIPTVNVFAERLKIYLCPEMKLIVLVESSISLPS